MWRWLDELQQDVRYALRSLRRNPAFAMVVVVMLALGVGANTAIFSLVDTVLLRLLPVERPQELVFLESAGTEGTGAPPYPCFERFRSETSAFAGIAAFAADELRVEVDGVVEQVRFGNVALTKEDTRAMWVWRWLDQLRQDMRHAFRTRGGARVVHPPNPDSRIAPAAPPFPDSLETFWRREERGSRTDRNETR